MIVSVTKTKLPGVLVIRLDIFEDYRGQYIETYNKANYEAVTGVNEFVQDDISVSTKNVLRGIHGDNETWKLITCLYGKIYLVVVNCDNGSSHFGKWESFILTEANGLQVLVPPKYGVGHLVLSEKAIFHYKQSTYYNPGKQFTYRYNDPVFHIWWPIKTPILSKRDVESRYP
jgi:dTDP-4-dehydrorhamnose 3,5-epimerase